MANQMDANKSVYTTHIVHDTCVSVAVIRHRFCSKQFHLLCVNGGVCCYVQCAC